MLLSIEMMGSAKDVDDDTPSFAISLYKEYRGIRTRMMKEMLALLKEKGYKRASLAVQKVNCAVRMYENIGFKTVDVNTEEYIMVCDLCSYPFSVTPAYGRIDR